jgi:large subunit ribosomal protein L23
MGIFQRIKGAPKAAAKEEKKPKAVEKTTEERVVAPKAKTAKFAHMIVAPRVSEKAAVLAHRGTYVFNVPISSNKVEVKKAVEALYNVKVESVNTVRGEGKIVRRGRTQGQRPNWKKALVTLKAGQKIDLYEGV